MIRKIKENLNMKKVTCNGPNILHSLKSGMSAHNLHAFLKPLFTAS